MLVLIAGIRESLGL